MKPLWTGIIWLSGVILTALVALVGFVAQEWLGGKPLPKLPRLLAFLQSHWLAFVVVAVVWAAVLWLVQWLKDRKTSKPDSPPSPTAGDHQATTTGNGSPAFGEVSGGQVFTGPVTIAQPPPSPTPPVSPSPQPLHQLPAPPADFTGRLSDLDELRRHFKTKGAVITGLRGAGGIGKTALALVVADELKKDFQDAQIFLDLKGASDSPMSPAQAMEHVIRSFDLKAGISEDPELLAGQYHSILDGKRALLLLDNARDAAQVRPLLPPSSCAVLITSRWNFELEGMMTRHIEELPMPEARALLLKIAPRIADLADAIAAQCGRLPFALRLAASAIKSRPMLSPADYLERLTRSRAKELDAVIASLRLSYDLLAPEHQLPWRLLGVFQPGSSFDRLAASQVWALDEPTAQPTLESLYAASMLEWTGSTGRYHLHDLAGDLARGLLSPAEQSDGGFRHARHFLDVLNVAAKLFTDKDKAKSLAGLGLFDRERTNIEAGQRWAAALHDQNKEALKLLAAFSASANDLLVLRQHPRAERIPWLNASLQACRVLGDRRGEGGSLGNLGNAYFVLGEPRKAIEFHQQQLEIVREIGDRSGEGAAMGNLGTAYAVLGETRKAIEFYQQALVIDREIGDRRGEGTALGNLGTVCTVLSEPRKAIEFHQQALFIVREIGDRSGEGNVLGNLGVAYKNLGEMRKAIEFHQQQLEIVREIGDRRGEGAALGNLGLAYADLGEMRKAIEFYQQALVIDREIGDRQGECTALGCLGLAYAALSETRKAIEFCQQRLVIAREIGDRRGEAATLDNLGNAYADLGETRKAIEFYQQALAIVREISDRRGEGATLYNSARQFFKLGQKAEAVARAETALAIFEAIEDPHAAQVRAQLAAWRGQGAA